MKNLLALMMIVALATASFAQNTPRTEYVKKGDLTHATIYHDNGMVAQKGHYTKEGKLTGTWMSYDAEGNITAKANYVNGMKDGTWTFYQGATKKEVTYDNSKIASVTTWERTETRVVSNK
ncbi:toxin-antitoxin system YwqK family antitoxin [Altibacter sp. HG106]|uniref:toxin-antitoxin system YwqK family antitoxin n=1 Tax=Altibacter sp. HG106 TaxID=3023937 RepID=UPI002350CDAD|nr:nicotinic acid mononucleotide adenyltransferase [Altibacter sp. HG106]MDC7994768.1 nicotinic acid mononucleotide adenyltransferase [Altibacter sp. HG106]